jgi:predicted amidohydrolase
MQHDSGSAMNLNDNERGRFKMKICVAQTRPVKGDIARNIANHKKLIELAVLHKAEIIIFPELSITGYEPELSKELATHPNDNRFEDFQRISDTKEISIGIGVPTKNSNGILITMVLFHPRAERQTYSKKYLHSDEEGFFVPGFNTTCTINGKKPKIALAICYELSVTEHAGDAYKNGAEMYIASAVKSVTGIDKAMTRLSEIGRAYSIPVLLSNCVGESGGYKCAGKSSVWNSKGMLIGQLGDSSEGILIYDTDSHEVVVEEI